MCSLSRTWTRCSCSEFATTTVRSSHMRVSKFDTIAHNRLNPLCHFPFFELAGWEESSPGIKEFFNLSRKSMYYVIRNLLVRDWLPYIIIVHVLALTDAKIEHQPNYWIPRQIIKLISLYHIASGETKKKLGAPYPPMIAPWNGPFLLIRESFLP